MKEQIVNYLNQSKTKEFVDLLFSFIDRTGQKDSDVYNRVGIDRRLFNKLKKGNRVLCKENIMRLCVSLELDLEDSQKLLGSAGYTFSTTSDFDLILRYCISNKIYDLETINGLLYDYTDAVLC